MMKPIEPPEFIEPPIFHWSRCATHKQPEAACTCGAEKLAHQQAAHPEPGMEPPRAEDGAADCGCVGFCPHMEAKDVREWGTFGKGPRRGQPITLADLGRPPLANPAHPADTPSPTGGLRYNAGKPRYDLLPPEALAALVKVFTRGAEKYAPRNWEKGMAWAETCFAALQRHAWRWMAGEDIDPETGCPHMAHAAWNALALVTYAARGVGQDDRPGIKREAPHEP